MSNQNTPSNLNEPKRKRLICNFDELPDTAYVRERNLCQSSKRPELNAPLPFSAASLWRFVASGSFPAPIKLSAGVTAWRVSDVRAWLASKQQA